MKHLFSIAASVLALGLLANSAQAAEITAADRAAVMAPVLAFAHAFNTNQEAFPNNALTGDSLVIDEFPPYSWGRGTSTVRDWYDELVGADTPKNRATVLASHQHVEVSDAENLRFGGGHAYMTVHAILTYVTTTGKPVTEHGLWTIVERRTPAGWRISANAWGVLK